MPIEVKKYATVASALSRDKPPPKFTLKKVFHMNTKRIIKK